MRAAKLVLVLSTLVLVRPVTAAETERRTIVIVPPSTAASVEYQWIGAALANAWSTRVALQPELNAVVARQVNAAIRQDNLEQLGFTNEANARKLGKLLGADIIIVGSYAASWPDFSMSLKALDPSTDSGTLGAIDLKGGLDKLLEHEATAARWLAQTLGASESNIRVGTFGTESLPAWRRTTLAQATLDWQSLGPIAADPATLLSLPERAVRTAMGELEEAIRLDDDYGEAWATLGIAQALLGDTRAAWRSFGKATALGFGHHPTAVVGASFTRMREGKFDDAARIFESAIARHPGFLHARGYLGELYNHRGQHKEALATFDAYAQVAPKNPWVLAQRGYAKSHLGDHRGAIEDTVHAVDLAPHSPSLLIQLASRYIDAGKLIGAEDALLQAMKLFPEETRIYVRLGYVYLLEGKLDMAIPVSEKALVQAKLRSSNRDRAYAHLNLARAYGQRGELAKAFEHLTAAKTAGVPSLAEVEGDPKLEQLRRDPRYKALAN